MDLVGRDDILLSIICLLVILILVWFVCAFVLRQLGITCVKRNEDDSTKNSEMINMDDDAHIEYSFEVVQPELQLKRNQLPFASNRSSEKPKPRFFESIMNGPVDSADEMSFIYDVYSVTETDEEKRTKAITARFAKYLDVPGTEPMILVSLHYIKDWEILVIAIIKVANLKPTASDEIIDPYVRVDVWIKSVVRLKKKTAVMREQLNPVFNQKMEFHVSTEDIKDVKIHLTIANNVPSNGGPRNGPVPLHKLEFGEQSTGSCLEQWMAATKTNKPIAKWHALY